MAGLNGNTASDGFGIPEIFFGGEWREQWKKDPWLFGVYIYIYIG